MKNLMVMSILALFAAVNSAHADGFLCEGLNSGLKIKIFNHTEAALGTRTPALMVISDPSVSPTRTTIATFSDENQTLIYQGVGIYLAKVDLRYTDSSRSGENIAGTKLGELKTIQVDLNFSYDSANAALARVTPTIPGKISYAKRTGEILEERLSCTRYLKTKSN